MSKRPARITHYDADDEDGGENEYVHKEEEPEYQFEKNPRKAQIPAEALKEEEILPQQPLKKPKVNSTSASGAASFKAVFHDKTTLRKIVESLKDLVHSPEIYIKNDYGMKIQSMDSSGTSLVSLHLIPEGFKSFYCKEFQKPCISMGSLHEILAIANPEDNVEISLRDDEDRFKDQLFLRFASESGGRVVSGKIRCNAVSNEPISMPSDIKADAEYTMKSSDFQRLVQQASKLKSEKISIRASKDCISFGVKQVGNCEVNLNYYHAKGDVSVIWNLDIDKVDEADNEKARIIYDTFRLKFFSFFSKISDLAPLVVIKIRENKPIVLSYNLKGGENGEIHLGNIQFVLSAEFKEDGEEQNVALNDEFELP